VARRAGIKHARSATPINTADTITIVNPSVGVTPNNSVAIKRVNANAPANPNTTPITTSVSPLRTISLSTSIVLAPSARRMPISGVLCVTAFDITP